jgi:hypothetical protein
VQRPRCCFAFQKLMMYSELKHYKYKDVILQQGEEGSKRLLIIGAGKVKIERQVVRALGSTVLRVRAAEQPRCVCVARLGRH